MTPSEYAELARLQAKYDAPPAAPVAPAPDSLFTRAGKQAANVLPSVVEGLMGSGTGLANLFGADLTPTEVPKFFDVAPARQPGADEWFTGEQAIDLGAGLASLGLQIAAPEAAGAKVLGALSAGQRAARIGGAALGWGASGLEHGPGEAALQGGMGATFAATEFLPRKARVPLALLSGALGFAEGSQRSPMEGAIMGGVNALLPFAHAQTLLKSSIKEVTSSTPALLPRPEPRAVDFTGELNRSPEAAYGSSLAEPDAFATLQKTVGQKGAEVPGWEKGILPMEPAPPVSTMGNVPERNGLGIELISEPAPAQPIFPLQPEAPAPQVAPLQTAPIAPAPTPPHPQTKLAAGLQTLLQTAPGWTEPGMPLGQGFTGDAFAFGKSFKTQKDVARAYAGAKKLEAAGLKMLETEDMGMLEQAQEHLNKAQYLREAAEFAEGIPGKLDLFKNRVDPDYKPSVPGKAYEEHIATLQNEAAPVAPTKSTPSTAFQSEPIRFQENGKWVEGKTTAREGDTLTVTVDDPIRGERTTFIQASEAKPRDVVVPETPKAGRAFEDVEGAKTIKSKAEGEFDDLESLLRNKDSEGYAIDENGDQIPWDEIPDPGAPSDDLAAYMQRYKSQTINAATKELSPIGGLVLKDMMNRLLKASGKEDLHVRFVSEDEAFNRIGSLNTMTGELQMGWDYTKRVLRDWKKMKPQEQAETIMSITKLFGHEISHAAVRVGKMGNMEIGGRNLIDAIEHEVMQLPLTARQFIAGQIKDAVGEKGIVSNYLAGDVKRVLEHYRQRDPNMTQATASKAAAEEFMVELMALELHKRVDVKGLPGPMRAVIDRMKAVFMDVMNYFRGVKSNVAALQNLQDIAIKTLDKFKSADAVDMHGSFPASKHWEGKAIRQLKDEQALRGFKPHVDPTDPMDWIVMDSASHPPMPPTSESFLKNEMVRLGARTLIGATAGGVLSGDQIKTSEGVLLGGILGAFGPTVARRILQTDLVAEGTAALKASKGNPIKGLEALMGGKTLKQLGGEALFTERNGVARFVRSMEVGLGINFDSKLRGILEHSRGLAAEQMSIVHDAMVRAKDFDVSPALEIATLQFLEGKMDAATFGRALSTAEEKSYGTLITTARSATDNLQTMFASGLKNGSFKDTVMQSIGKYTGKFYTAYTKGEFNAAAFDKAKADLKAAFPTYSNDVAEAIMYQHMREAKANQTMFGRVSTNGQQLDPALWKSRLATESEIEAQQAIVDALNPKDTDFASATDKLRWMQSHKITDGWGEWLGEIKNPKERILRTFQKLYSSSISGKTFDLLSRSETSAGNKFAYGAEELSKMQMDGAARLAKLSPTDPAFATLQKQLDELRYYVPLPTGAQYGKLSGKMVDRFVRDSVATDTSPFKWMDQPVFRAISSFNNVIKLGRTAFNPITVIRNYFQMPMFGLIAKTNTTDMVEAWQHIHKRTDVHRQMLREGITSVDMSAAELTDGPGKLFSGFFDSDAATRLASRGIDKALEIYRAPDSVLRAGTFISAVKRFADGDLTKGLADASIVERARDFTNRYTMNYHAVPNVIKVGRQLPFVSLFLSYTSEITRILKNLVADAVSPTADSAGRVHALGMLGGMAALPALMIAAGENSLSAKDRKEWERVKTLSPSYAKMRFRVPLGRKENGSFRYMDITNLLPADAYSMMVRSIADGDFATAASVNPVVNLTNTPLLNIATEQITGKDTHTGRALKGMDRGREVLREILPPVTPGLGYEAERIANAFTPNERGGLGLTNIRTGRSVMPSDIVMNYITGMKFATVNADVLQRGVVADAKQQIAEQQQLLRQTTSTDTNTMAKKAAMEHFNSAVKEIILQMHEKLNLQ